MEVRSWSGTRERGTGGDLTLGDWGGADVSDVGDNRSSLLPGSLSEPDKALMGLSRVI